MRQVTLINIIKEAFKGKHAKIIENGTTVKLQTREGKTLYLYNFKQNIQQEKIGVTKTEKEYIDLFKNTIQNIRSEM